MAIFNAIRGRRDHHVAAGTTGLTTEDFKDEDIKVGDAEGPSDVDSDDLSLYERNEKEIQRNPNSVTSGANAGIQKAEAVALIWDKKFIWASYAWIWLCFFMLAFQNSIQYNVSFYAYSAFAAAPALTTANILAVIIGGVLKLPIAKLINIWGRSEALLVFTAVFVLGMILIAASTGPDTYAAGYTLYYIGYDALYLILDIYIADSFGLQNRALAFAFATTPFICTAFTGPLAAQSFVSPTGSGWQWAIGTFCIVNTVVFVPLAVVFKLYQRKAIKMGILKKESSGRTALQSTIHYIHEFDVIGAIILCAAFVLFLLPFSLQSYGRASYTSATFIAMVVIGFCLFFVFYAWERYFARVHFINYKLFRERTVLGACCLAAIIYFSFYSWDLQYYNYVKVVYALPVGYAGYMSQIYNVGSTFWSVIFGVWLRYTKRFKYTALCFGLPLMMLGAGLMVHFRGGNSSIGYIVMCQIFIAFSGGTLIISEDMAVMTAADREGVPLMLSLIYLFSSIGGAIGQSVSTAIYSNTFPSALASALPDDLKYKTYELYYGGYTVQEMFVPGTVIREAVNYAWERTQYYSCISAVAILVLGFPAIGVWKNYKLDKKQNKGVVI